MMILKQALCSLALLGVILHFVTGGRSNAGSKVDTSDGAAPWPGHLEPLGAKAVQRAVPVLEDFPSPETFYADYILGSLPVVFRNGGRLSPAFKSWSDKDLMLRPDAETTIVDVETRKKEDRKQPTQRMKFTEFLERYKTEDEYLVDSLPKFLREDVIVPPPLVCDEVLQRISDVVMWFSSGGTKSLLHNDDTDNINCLFSGQKDILFLNYTQYRHQFHLDHPEGSYSSVDVEKVDMIKYPGLRNVEFYKAKLFPGDCIYIPYKWMHQVNSMSRNIAVNVWFDHSCEKAPSPEICGSTDRRLTIADVQLGVEQALDFVEDFEENTPSADEELINTLKNEKLQRYTPEDFTMVLHTRVPMLNDLTWTKECDELSQEAFDLMDLTEDGFLDKEDFTKLEDVDEFFSFQLESKLLMLSDIAHEQQVQERQRVYEMEMKQKKTAKPDDPNMLFEQVEPLNLNDIDWGDDEKIDDKQKDSKKTEGTNKGGVKTEEKEKDGKKIEEKNKDGIKTKGKKVEQRGEEKSAGQEMKRNERDDYYDDDSGVDVKVEL